LAPSNHEQYLPRFLDVDHFRQHDIHEEDHELIGQTSELYAAGLSEFRGSGWSRSVLSRWLEARTRDAPSSPLEIAAHHLNAGLCRARGAANGTDHETMSDVHYSETWLMKSAHRLLTGDRAHEDHRTIEAIPIPREIGAWLVSCDYEDLLQQVKTERLSFLRAGSSDAFKALASKIADVMIKSPGPLSVEPSKQLVRILRIVTVETAVLKAAELVLDGTLSWPEAATAIGAGSRIPDWLDRGVRAGTTTFQKARLRRQFVFRAR
jgi:hypothetical protein